MLQNNSIFNFFNQSSTICNHVATTNKLWVFNLNNSYFFLSSPAASKFDSLNNHSTGYRGVWRKFRNGTIDIITWYFLIQWAHLGFRGKSYRIRNFCRVNKFTFNLGYSHWTRLKLLDKWAFFKRRRQNYVVFTYLSKDFLYFRRFIPFVRFYNCYTMRGLRLRKQPIIRRFGKISQHISSLH